MTRMLELLLRFLRVKRDPANNPPGNNDLDFMQRLLNHHRKLCMDTSNRKFMHPQTAHMLDSLCEEANKNPNLFIEMVDGFDRPWQRIKHKYPFNPELESHLK